MESLSNADLARRLYDLLNAGDVAAVGDLVTADYVEHDPLPGQGEGRDGVVDRFSMIVGALAPTFTIEDIIAEGDRVVVRWTQSGTHVSDFMGAPATGRTFQITGIDVYRVSSGELAEHWHVVDQLGLMAQLGLLPVPA